MSVPKGPTVARIVVVVASLVALLAAAWPSSSKGHTTKLEFVYTPDAAAVVEPMIREWNASHDGVVVRGTSEPSGAAETQIVERRTDAVLWMPAASSWTALLEYDLEQEGLDRWWQAAGRSFFWSPEVIAMWRQIAEPLGAVGEPFSFHDLRDLVTGRSRLPGEGSNTFLFAHPKPERSTSGLFAVAAEFEAFRTAREVGGFERSIAHYGDLAKDFCPLMQQYTTNFVSAAYLQEAQMMICNDQMHLSQAPLVALYPAGGTFRADYPLVVLDRAPWVDREQAAAARGFLQWFGEHLDPQLVEGPGSRLRPVGSPVDAATWAASGAEADGPESVGELDVPTGALLHRMQWTWEQHLRKRANVVLILDRSSQMSQFEQAFGEEQFVRDLLAALPDQAPGVRVAAITFSDAPHVCAPPGSVDDARGSIEACAETPVSRSPTSALDDAIEEALALPAMRDPSAVNILVVVSAGVENGSTTKPSATLDDIRSAPVQVFTVSYSDEPGAPFLKAIAQMGTGWAYEGRPREAGTSAATAIASVV